MTTTRHRDAMADLPDTIGLDEIREKADSLWQQRAAVRPASEGGPAPAPVVPVKTYRPSEPFK